MLCMHKVIFHEFYVIFIVLHRNLHKNVIKRVHEVTSRFHQTVFVFRKASFNAIFSIQYHQFYLLSVRLITSHLPTPL